MYFDYVSTLFNNNFLKRDLNTWICREQMPDIIVVNLVFHTVKCWKFSLSSGARPTSKQIYLYNLGQWYFFLDTQFIFLFKHNSF